MVAESTATMIVHELMVHPRGSIIARDGRPFAATPGAQATSLPWPLPSTLAGALRTKIGSDLHFDWQGDGPERARRIMVQGPLMLVRWSGDASWTLYVAAPRDALIVQPGDGSTARMVSLRPFKPPEGAGCNMPHAGLQPLQVTEAVKPISSRRFTYWPLPAYIRWLDAAAPAPEAPPDRCVGPLPHDIRVHVAMNAETRTGREGAIFSTVGLAFADRQHRSRNVGEDEQPARAMLCRVASMERWTPESASYASLGGERRLIELRQPRGGGKLWPACPPRELSASLVGTRRLRLALATPALFDGGWKPGWLDDDLVGTPPGPNGPRLRLVGAAIGRREPVSGWDLQKKHAKAARYMVPAGSVLFFDVVENALTEQQVTTLWMTSVSDRLQDRMDGFGLALPGAW